MPPPEIDPSAAEEFAREVARQLRAGGFQALWAGGCVRDRLLGKTPKDYDVATNATPAEIQKSIRQKTLAIGAAFGVITVLGPRRAGQVEVATFRRDAGYSDGRHPDSVSFTDAREDAIRRDFTMNGLFLDPLHDEVIDYVNGQRDLESGIVRAIGDPVARFAEDKLRMLRAVRFAATFDFEIDPATFSAIQAHAGEISVVSAERITQELRRMLCHGARSKAVELMYASRLLAEIIPEIPWRPSRNDAFGPELLRMLQGLTVPSFPAAMALLLREIQDRSEAAAICHRGKLANLESESVLFCLTREGVIQQADRLPWSQVQPVLIHRCAQDLVEYADAVATGLERPRGPVDFCRERLAWPRERLQPPPLIGGDDLQAVGIPAGPPYRGLLQAARDAQLDGQIENRDQALELVNRLWAQQQNQQ